MVPRQKQRSTGGRKRPLSGKTVWLLVCWLLPCLLAAQEICDNGLDDDADTLVDLNDPDCACQVIEPKSLIPNPSFEEMNCCPFSRSQLDCAETWIQASEPTTDYINTCGWMGWDEFPPPQPFPDGDGIMGFRDGRVLQQGMPETNWKEYAGACLLRPLLAGTSYRFEFDVGFVDAQQSPPINVSFFGTTDCDYLPFGTGNEAFGCPTNGPNWKKLGEVRVSGGGRNTWVKASIEIIPEENIRAIAIGPDCSATYSSVSTYYFFDNLLLADLEVFELRITELEHPCSPDFTLTVPFNSAYDYQWYLEGRALAGETEATLSRHYGEGSYQVRITDEQSCRLTEAYAYRIPTFRTPARVAICEDDSYLFGDRRLIESGDYVDTFATRFGCDSIVDLQLEVIGDTYDTLTASVLNGELFEIGDYGFRAAGDYPLTFTSSLGCDSLVLLQLSSFDIFIPNAFSPNADGRNDLFQPFAAGELIESVDMQVFDRWGNSVYRGAGWDGGDMPSGYFVYTMLIAFRNGREKRFSGGVTLVR
ncbi:gliding motility-associated C-terminal domain-containing protein [Lewinella sp. IMCC34191]|uniref:T9SS type B sorting domain-containing protein n=1 Tax=Lewinella sp. IMCC34191 TaxID=2259172 RepID=UPI001E34C92D|nr:gliding motility-associated C-terminal domain-containing protein [Lewinella sp. IMCC34191]